MKILVLNGSPKGVKSNTYRITEAFLGGMERELGDGGCEIENVCVYDSRIEHCKGCFCCWTSTPGSCVLRDDMDRILPAIVEAGLIVWSFPLYYYGMPSKLKALLDRNLPLNLPYIVEGPDGGCSHPSRHGTKPRGHVLISTCGFHTTQHNYEALIQQFDILFGDGYSRILCPEGELFSHRELDGRTGEYLSYAFQAGREYALIGRISPGTMKCLDERLYPPEVFVEMANVSWDIKNPDGCLSPEEKKIRDAWRFTRQMAAIYQPASFDGNERVFEIYYTDVGAGFQLVMGKERCEVRDKDFTAYTTRVETPLTVWQDIAMGVSSGEQAMMEGRYRTYGDLRLLISWGRYFGMQGAKKAGSQGLGRDKKTNLALMLAPWVVIWMLLPLDPVMGGAAGICAAALLPIAGMRWELTPFDACSCFCVAVAALLAVFGFDMQMVVPASYLCFGGMWLLSCLTRAPLTAHYSKERYGGDGALANPLFIRTNLILTVCWGALYLITPIWTYLIMGGSMPYLASIINLACPTALGVFTNWFEAWYPAKVARG